MRFIEIEGFQIDNGKKWVIKELCVLDQENILKPLYYLFTIDVPFNSLSNDEKFQVKFVAGNIHGLNWYEGTTKFCVNCVEKKIIEDFGLGVEFYTMGEQKTHFLSNLFPNIRIINVGDERTIKTLPNLMPHITCLHRHHGEHCAVRKCYRLAASYNL